MKAWSFRGLGNKPQVTAREWWLEPKPLSLNFTVKPLYWSPTVNVNGSPDCVHTLQLSGGGVGMKNQQTDSLTCVTVSESSMAKWGIVNGFPRTPSNLS